MEIDINKLKEYLADEMILEFSSPEACMKYLNAFDGKQFQTIDEMKEFQGDYGFGREDKWYHISFQEALDVHAHLPYPSEPNKKYNQ